VLLHLSLADATLSSDQAIFHEAKIGVLQGERVATLAMLLKLIRVIGLKELKRATPLFLTQIGSSNFI